jgi:hypothetical protein
MPNADQQRLELEALQSRYRQLGAMLRGLLPEGVYDDDADPLDESVLADIGMIGAEMRVTTDAMGALLTGKTR